MKVIRKLKDRKLEIADRLADKVEDKVANRHMKRKLGKLLKQTCSDIH
jgi:hypothetical protein